MSKIKFFLTLFSFFLLSCNTDNNTSLKINEVFENYYQENLKLYPLNATRQGDIRYNDFLPNNLTDEFRNKEKIYYLNYVNQLNKFDDNKLNEDDKLSKKVMLWECTRNLERLDLHHIKRQDLFLYQRLLL